MNINNISLDVNMATQVQSIPSVNEGTSQLIQSPRVVTPDTSDVIYRTQFSPVAVKQFTEKDFNVNTNELISIKYDDCILVLFYTENAESQQLVKIWSLVAQQTAGPLFAAVNLLNERGVAEAFTKLRSSGSHPYHWAGLRGLPFILTYRQGWPVAAYNGDRETQAIIDYALTLACQAGYYETIQMGGGMQAEAQYEMGPYQNYYNLPGEPDRVRKVSSQYVAQEPVRGFNPTLPLVAKGSPEAAELTQTIQQEQARVAAERASGLTGSLTQTSDVSRQEAVQAATQAQQGIRAARSQLPQLVTQRSTIGGPVGRPSTSPVAGPATSVAPPSV